MSDDRHPRRSKPSPAIGEDEDMFLAPPPAQKPQRPGKGKGNKKPSILPALRQEMRPDTPALRAERVEAIRRDLLKRRRRKGGKLLLRLMIFVLIPTLFVAVYLWNFATPLFVSHTVFTVQSAEGGVSGGGGGLLSRFLGGAAGGNDPVAVQSFILSRDVLERLDADEDFIAHFQDPEIDRRNRIEADTSFEDAFDHYLKMVRVSYDPSEGVLEMAVRATTAEDAKRFSDAIIGYAEEMVDQLSDPIREAALSDAESSVGNAEERLVEAQSREAMLRNQRDIFSIEAEVAKEMQIIAAQEAELDAMVARRTNLLRVTDENDPRVERLTAQIETKTDQIQLRRNRITGGGADRASLADINSELQRATFEVTAAMAMFTSAIEAREAAQLELQRQHRYLANVAGPSLPDQPKYPRKFQTTALAFLIFLGSYILLSLTFSLIREQASI